MAYDDNPFSAGSAGSGAPPAEGLYAPVDIEVGAVLTRAWELFKQHPGIVLGAVLLPVIPAVLLTSADWVLQFTAATSNDQSMVEVSQMVSIVISIVSTLVGIFLQLGTIRILVRVTRGQDAEIGMLVGEGGSYLSALLASLLVFVAVAFGLVLLIIPGMVIGLGLQFVLYVLIDRDLGPIEAMQESWRITDGYKLSIFAVNLVVGLLMLVFSCATLGLGYFLAVPVMSLVQAVMYHALSHRGGAHADLGSGLGLS